MPVRLGINPLTWSNDDMPELGGETPLETCLSETRQAGYEGIELGNKFPRRADILRPILQGHRLALVSGWYSSRLLERSVTDEIAALEDHLTLLAAMGCKVVVYAEVTGAVHGDRGTPLSRRPVLPESRWPEFADRLNAIARHIQMRGLRLAYHHHMGTVVESEADVERLMSVTGPEVGLLLDTGHLTFAGGDPIGVARRHAARIVHVHCKDVRLPILAAARSRNSSFLNAVLDGVFTVPGDGGVDYKSVLPALHDRGYSGWLVVEAEQDPAKAHPLTYAQMGYDNLSALARSAGWAIR